MASKYAFLKLKDDIAWPEFTNLVKTSGAQAIENILNAVGKKYVPHNLDREALRIAIADAYHSRGHGSDLLGGSEAQARLKHVRRIRKTTEKLARLLGNDLSADAMIASQLRPPVLLPLQQQASSVASIIEQILGAAASIERVQECIAKKWRTAHKRDPDLRGRRVTEKEWLAGVSLPLVFERFFLRRAGRSHTKHGEPSGPMVRFISAALKEVELDYGEGAIVRAYSRRAPLRAQQRKGKVLPLISRQI